MIVSVASSAIAFAIWWYFVGGAILQSINFALSLALNLTLNLTIQIKLPSIKWPIILTRGPLTKSNEERHQARSGFSGVAIRSAVIGAICGALLTSAQLMIDPKSDICKLGERCTGIVSADFYSDTNSGKTKYTEVNPGSHEAKFIAAYLRASEEDCSELRRSPVKFTVDESITISVAAPNNEATRREVLVRKGQSLVGLWCKNTNENQQHFETIKLEVRDEDYWK